MPGVVSKPSNLTCCRYQIARSLPLHANKVILVAAAHSDKLVVVSFGTLSEAGAYAVALTFASLIPGLLRTSIKQIVLPALISKSSQNRAFAATRILKTSWLLSIIGATITIFVGPFLIPFAFGEEFGQSILLSSLLALSVMPKAANDALVEIIKSYERTWEIVPATIIYLLMIVFGGPLLYYT